MFLITDCHCYLNHVFFVTYQDLLFYFKICVNLCFTTFSCNNINVKSGYSVNHRKVVVVRYILLYCSYFNPCMVLI